MGPQLNRVFALTVLVVSQLSACGPGYRIGESKSSDAETTYQKILLRAEAGDGESQNVLGFMLFHGEGVAMDRVRAELWFRQAAEQGNARGLHNLAVMTSMGPSGYGSEPQREPGIAVAEGRLSGEGLYGRFCAGCHGFNGIARYVHSPSFALGQTLEKSDGELMLSLLHGKGEMPNWDNKLSLAELQDILRFVRTLRLRYEAGIGQPLRSAPSLYFLFGPMSSDIEGTRSRAR